MKLLKALFLLAVLPLKPPCSKAQNSSIPCPQNIIVSADKGKEGAIVNFPTPSAELGNATYTPASGSFFRLGSHSVIVTNTAGKKCSFTVIVTDNESPELSPITLSRTNLWPASNKLKKVTVNYSASDNGGKVTTTVSVTSNATDGLTDFEILDDHLIRLKASRLPEDKARIYQVSVTATDEAGNKTTRSTSIAVSKTITTKTNRH